ncbi:hypothetical protein [Archangium lansingense]|uniref:Uncharacterized protein n=1 Tax=Archangium lansingense TaxID=2995310 RepID=A0ABT4A0F7_9BACT|nr:hypothetical protein [Archangium lansinium]MCY1075071.1 hypothetical protein [Archangium lansinium]
MAARNRMETLLLVGGMLALASVGGWRLWKWSRLEPGPRPVELPRAQPGEAGEGEVAAAEDPGDLGWDEDLGKEGYIVWRPRLGLQAPWTDSVRPLTGGVKLQEEELPHGLCHPSIVELYVELFVESHMGEGVIHALGDNPKVLEVLLPMFKSSYFKIPEIDLYGPRDEKKGSKPVSSKSSKSPETVAVSVNMKVLTLCVGLSASACAAVQVRQVDTEWLEDCPKEARVAIEALGLGTGEPYDVGLGSDYLRRQETPLFMKEGPLVARWEGLHLGPDFPRSELGRRMKGAKLYGRAKSYGNRMSVQFKELELADGRKLPICAIGYDVWGKEPGLERWGPGSHPGVNVGNDDPKMLAALKELRPGEFPVVNTTIWISFGMPLRAQWLARR